MLDGFTKITAEKTVIAYITWINIGDYMVTRHSRSAITKITKIRSITGTKKIKETAETTMIAKITNIMKNT